MGYLKTFKVTFFNKNKLGKFKGIGVCYNVVVCSLKCDSLPQPSLPLASTL